MMLGFIAKLVCQAIIGVSIKSHVFATLPTKFEPDVWVFVWKQLNVKTAATMAEWKEKVSRSYSTEVTFFSPRRKEWSL